jgi:hypothetical protein
VKWHLSKRTTTKALVDKQCTIIMHVTAVFFVIEHWYMLLKFQEKLCKLSEWLDS